MIKTSILIEDDGLTAILQRLEQQFGQAGIAAINEEAGRRIGKIVVLRYPEQTNAELPKIYRWDDGELHKFPTIAAQRGFFAKLAAGQIRIPYRRTGTLARSLDFFVEVQGFNALIRVSIPDEGKAGKYARYVVGREQERSYYFRNRTNWQPLTFQIEGQEQEITAAVKVAYETIVEDLGL